MQEQSYINSSSAGMNRRSYHEGVKQENTQYSMSSLNYPNNVLQRNGSNPHRNTEEYSHSYINNVRSSLQQQNQSRNVHISYEDNNQNHQNYQLPQYTQNSTQQNDNFTLGQQLQNSRSLQNNQNYLNMDLNRFIPNSHNNNNNNNNNPQANPNYLNPYVSFNHNNVQTFNSSSQQQLVQPKYEVYQQCPSHPKYDITNICVSESCIEPLCPECVKIHTFMHNQKDTPTNIDTILCKRDQCIEYVRELRDNFNKEQTILNRIGDIEKGDIFQQCLDQIQNARDLAIQNINSFFNTFEIKIKQRINDIRINNPHLFGSINSKILAMIREVQDMEMKLESPSYVKYVIQILSDDFNIDFERIQQDVDYGIEHYLNQLFKVEVNVGLMDELNELLEKYIVSSQIDINEFKWREDSPDKLTHEVLHSNLFIKKTNLPDNKKDKENQRNIQDLFDTSQKKLVPQPIDYNTVSFPTQVTQQFNQNQSDLYDHHVENQFENTSSKLPHQQNQLKSRPKSEHINPYSNPNNNNNNNINLGGQLDGDQSPLEKSYNSTKDDKSAHINIYDYFTPDCMLNIVHFFQDNSKCFHFLDLSLLSKDPSTQEWQTVELSINFKIPMFHRSIITPNGKIYLIGGIDVLHKNKSINNTYFLDMNRNTLELCAHMNQERNSHSLVVAQDSIFVVGGLNSNDEDIYLSSCERFDIETQKWIQIADMQEGVSGTVLINFSDKYIYRFGGKTYLNNISNAIERYNIQDDFWEYVAFQFNDTIPCFASGCQINENEMIILGGQVGEINQKQTIIARVDYNNQNQEDTISFYYSKSLPNSGTFWQNPIIGGNVLFAMQNIKMENSQMNYFSKKALYVFNSRTWKELGHK